MEKERTFEDIIQYLKNDKTWDIDDETKEYTLMSLAGTLFGL